MTIRKLEIFYRVSVLLNMTKVAKEMYISQPSISQVIKELEEDFGCKLFERIGKKLFLTSEGELLKKYSLRILNLHQEAYEKIESVREGGSGCLKIGASTTIGTYILPNIIAKFKKRYPNIHIDLRISNTKEISDKLLENLIDIAFIEGNVSEEELEKKFFLNDELVIISAPDKDLKDNIKLEQLKELPFIQREKGSGSRNTYENILEYEIEDNYILESTEAIKKVVKNGLGVGCVSLLSVSEEVGRGELVVSRIEGKPIKRQLQMLYHRDKEFSMILKEFLKLLEEAYK